MALGTDGLITVVGDVDTITDTKASGTLTVTLSDKLVVGDKTYFPIDQIVNLNPNDGTFAIKLPPTGDSGVTYRFSLVAYAFVNGQREHFEETTDTVLTADQADAQGVIQYNSLLKVAAPGVPQTFLTRTAADTRYLLKDEIPELPTGLVTEDQLNQAIADIDIPEVDLTPVNAAIAVVDVRTSALLKVQAGTPDAMVSGAITRNSNGAATAFDVLWPDGATGRFTGTASTSFPGAVDSYNITHVLAGVVMTYSQPPVTRDASGAVTNRPAITSQAGAPAPTALTLSATPADGSVTVTPAGAVGRTTYALYRGTTATGTPLTTTFGAFTDTGRPNGTPVSYYAVAINDGGQVTATATATPVANAIIPTAPTIFATAGNGQVTVSQGTAGTNVATTSVRRNSSQVATALPFTDTGLTNETQYEYTVVVTSTTGNSATSNSVVATPTAVVPTASFADFFTATDSADISGRTLPDGADKTKTWGHPYTNGRMGIVNGIAKATGGVGNSAAFPVFDAALTTFKVSATFPTLNADTSRRRIGFVFRAQSDTNYFRVDGNTGPWLVRKIINGAATTLITGSTAAAGDTVELTQAAGGVLSLKVNGVTVGTSNTQATDLVGVTVVGMYGQGQNATVNQDVDSSIDNFSVTPI